MNSSSGPAQRILPHDELSAIPARCRPRALGAVARLGLGSRTTVLGWPAIFRFLSESGLFANAIQNSVARELMPLEMLGDPSARPTTLQPGLGQVPVGHTGSTIEGLPQWGMRSAAEAGYAGPGFGADADHLPVFAPEGDRWERTVRLIGFSREYTHFTLDIGAIMAWERGPVARLAQAPRAIAAAVREIEEARAGQAFDLEISLDESPESISPEDASTRPEEIARLLDDLIGEGISPDYVAPHFGFTKGSDVTDRARLADVAGTLCRAAGERGALLSIHSGDNLSSATRRVLGQATGGKLLFKVAPALQNLFFDAVFAHDQAPAAQLIAWVLNYAEQHGTPGKSPAETVHKYAFAAFGVRNDAGAFEMRELLYGAGEVVKEAYRHELTRYLRELADDLGMG